MEFPFDVNVLFPERISTLDHDLASGRKSFGRPDVRGQIATVVDELGIASSKAQQLPAAITSASKLQSTQHHLYLLKEGGSKGGRGVIVGFLKVGYKKLFLLDQRGAHIEAEPLCVLDFYITENLQRNGYGLELFDFMLQHKRVEPALMAYDRPSPKFLSFLAKHYCLTESVPQVNNFVVFDGFFLNRSAAQLRKPPPKRAEGEIKPYSLMEREVVREEQRARPWPFVQPAAPLHSPQRSASSLCSRSLSVGSSPSRAPPCPAPAPAPAPGGRRGQKPQFPLIDQCRARRTRRAGLAGSLSSWAIPLPPLGEAPFKLPGLRAVLRDRGTDTGGQTCEVGHTDTDRSCPLSLPPLVAPRNESLCGLPASLEAIIPANGRACRMETEVGKAARGPNRGGGWSWTLEESFSTAQWVKQKQEYRNTRPW